MFKKPQSERVKGLFGIDGDIKSVPKSHCCFFEEAAEGNEENIVEAPTVFAPKADMVGITSSILNKGGG